MSEILSRTTERKLWHEGPNFTADAIVLDPDSAKVLLIQRGDTGDWALPGGFIDATDTSSCAAAIREVSEEAGLSLAADDAPLVFRGKVTDPRNNASSWIETSAHLFTMPSSQDIHSGDDAAAAAWCHLADLPTLYGSHQQLIEHGLDYLEGRKLLAIADSPTAEHHPVDGGFMQYDKWIIEDDGERVFTKNCPAQHHRSDELLRYIKKEAGVMAHLRQSGFRHLPHNSLYSDSRLMMDAIRSEDGWNWRMDREFIDQYLEDVLDAFAELETMPLPPSTYDVEDSYDSFVEEGWQLFDEEAYHALIEKYRSFSATLPLNAQATAQQLLWSAPGLHDLATALPRSEEFVFCHHDIRETNFAWHPEEGIKIIDWSWAGPGLPGSDATRLLIDLHKNGYDVDAYRDYISPEHCLNLIGFWLVRSTVPSQGADGLREQQFISALSAYELLQKIWPMPVSALVDPAYEDRFSETTQAGSVQPQSQKPDGSLQRFPA